MNIESLKVGILGTGGIADTIIRTLKQTNGVEVYAVASRQIERAVWYAKHNGISVCYGSYESLIKDSYVDLVYVATPHSEHYGNVMMALENGKNVLCEKAFMLNAEEARNCVIVAQKNHCYLAEAMWTRYLPAIAIVKEFLASGVIGEIRGMQCNLAYDVMNRKRITTAELGGGALLDLGVYGIHFIRSFMGENFEKVESSARLENGVDIQNCIAFYFPDGKMATTTHAANYEGENGALFFGEKGYVRIDYLENPKYVEAYDKNHNLIATCSIPAQITGYEYQFLEAKACIEKGYTETEKVPHAETIAVMEIMDRLRKQWGVEYPSEK